MCCIFSDQVCLNVLHECLFGRVYGSIWIELIVAEIENWKLKTENTVAK